MKFFSPRSERELCQFDGVFQRDAGGNPALMALFYGNVLLDLLSDSKMTLANGENGLSASERLKIPLVIPISQPLSERRVIMGIITLSPTHTITHTQTHTRKHVQM